MEFTGTTSRGDTVRYTDGKRFLWVFPIVGALIGPLTAAAYFLSGANALWTLFPLFYFFLVIPAIDMLIGEDTHNPPEEVTAAMAADPYYRRLLHAMAPAYYLSFLIGAVFIGTQNLPVWAFIAFTIGLAMLHANVLTIGHELGHKQNKTDQWAAKIMNAMIGYGHFCIEHNRGHHVWVSTPEDPASSRMGESIYAFALRELPGTFRRGVAHEKRRLEKRGKSFWSLENDILQGYAIALVIGAALTALFGWIMLPFLLLHHFFGWYGLTQANYVEHYGLKREKDARGKYEPCAPRHSWNTNHIVSNLFSFHLQRHSDHHANPQRPYQALRNFSDLPRLPSGYPGCFGLAAIPPLWFRVMDPKVMAWAQGDIDKVNLAPQSEARLRRQFSTAPAA